MQYHRYHPFSRSRSKDLWECFAQGGGGGNSLSMRFSLETFEGAPARDQGPRPSLHCRFSVSLIFHVSETLKKALACFKVLHVTIPVYTEIAKPCAALYP